MHQIRRRPADQSSDEEDSEKDHNVQPASPYRRKRRKGKESYQDRLLYDRRKSFPEIMPLPSMKRLRGKSKGKARGKAKGRGSSKKKKSVSTVYSIEKNDGKISDFSMFKTNQMRCKKGGDSGFVMHCDSLKRLGAALSVYATINDNGDVDEIESENPIFAEFVGSEYRVQFMEDFNHFMEEHQGSNEEIKQEMMEMYRLKKCETTDCELTTRHFSPRRPDQRRTATADTGRSEFYRKKFDSLHFHIFHLEESGYRYRHRHKSETNGTVTDEVDSKVDDEEGDEKAMDREFGKEVAAVNECKKKCHFDRFQGDELNKFSLNVSAKTWLDQMIEYVHSAGIPNDIIRKMINWLHKQDYDTDAIKLDVNIDSVQSQQSSVLFHMKHEPLIESISKFVDKTKVSTFSIGLRFIYWEKSRGYKSNAFTENDDLYIDVPQYENIKEELLNSGYCGIFEFSVLMIKCKELMLCKKVMKMKASSTGTAKNKGYGIKKDDPITINHVQCVVSYCDQTDFCSAFSATFRSEFVGESVVSIKERNQSYYHISKGLREAVECFGNNGQERNRKESGPFYCGMNTLLLLEQFGIRLNGPTSTSTSRAVAIRFAGEQGIVLKMNNEEPYLHFLDCMPFSRYPEEEERLFMGGRYPVIVKSILIMETAQNFSHFFGVLSVFDCVVNGSDVRRVQMPPTKDYRKLQHLFDWSLGTLDNDLATFPDFIYRTFECYRDNKTEILLDFWYLGNTGDALKVYYEPVVHSVEKRPFGDTEDDVNALKWDNIFAIFPNIKMVTLDCGNGEDFWGFSLTAFVRKVYGDILPKYPKLDSVVVKGVPQTTISAVTGKMEEVVSQCKVQLLIEDDRFGKTLILKRE